MNEIKRKLFNKDFLKRTMAFFLAGVLTLGNIAFNKTTTFADSTTETDELIESIIIGEVKDADSNIKIKNINFVGLANNYITEETETIYKAKKNRCK